MARPEFEGMWNKFERYVVPKEVVVDVIKGNKVSKMEQDIMRDKLDRQRDNIVQPQIAAGREFKGKSSFNSKPTVVHFKVRPICKFQVSMLLLVRYQVSRPDLCLPEFNLVGSILLHIAVQVVPVALSCIPSSKFHSSSNPTICRILMLVKHTRRKSR